MRACEARVLAAASCAALNLNQEGTIMTKTNPRKELEAIYKLAE